MKNLLNKTVSFVKEVVIAAKDHVVSFVRGFYQHFESVGLLTLASLGLSTLLAEIPFYVALPMWIELPMVIPVISIFIVIALIKSAEYRSNRRMVVA